MFFSKKLLKSMITKEPCIEFFRLYSSVTNEQLIEWSKVKSMYSDKQLRSVYNVINKCDSEDMKRLKISEDRVKFFESLKDKSKTLKSLDDFVSFNEISVPELQSICSAVIVKKEEKSKKSRIVSRPVKKEDIYKIKNVVGLRLGGNYVAWSNVLLEGSDCNVLNWNCQYISDMSQVNMNHTDIIKLGMNIAGNIPQADAFVMEKEESRSTSKMSVPMMRFFMRQQQLSSVILTSIFSKRIAHFDQEIDDDFFNSLYTMRPFASAQLFGLFLGNETVSCQNVVQNLLYDQNLWLKNISSVSLSNENSYHHATLNNCEKEELYKSMLMALTFFELVVLE